MSRRRVAVIGSGFSGAMVAANLLKRGREAPDVVLIERGERFGPGLAYGTKDPSHLLNVRAGNLSAFADKPDHFARWLKARGQRDAPTTFARRSQYGAYVEAALRGARSFGGPKLERMRDEAVACEREGEGWAVTLGSGKRVAADVVVLALGNGRPAAPSVFDGVPMIDPWDAAALKRIGSGDVLLLGAGLTMIDVALALAKRRRKGTIYALSRRGLTPRAHLQRARPPEPATVDLPLPLSEALHVFRREAQAMEKRGEPWQHAVDRLRARTPELWRRLPLETQQRFLRHLRPWWDVHRHRAAPEIETRVSTLRNTGRLKVLAGEIASVTRQGRKFEVFHRGRGSLARHRMEVAAIVNCTGGQLDPRQSEAPLVRQLLEAGHARAQANGLGFDVDVDGHVIGADGAPHGSLFALGPITQGTFWESTAVPEIRVRAAALALMLAPEL